MSNIPLMKWRVGMFRTIAYWFVLMLTIFFIIVSICFGLVEFYRSPSFVVEPPPEFAFSVSWKELIPVGILILTALSTFSAVFLGWRLDRRQAKELSLKTKDLELKIKELELKLASTQISTAQPPPQQFPNF